MQVTDCIHPDTEADMFADDDINEAFQRAAPRGPNNPLFTGEIGDYLGVKFVVTSNAKIYASLGLSGADVYGTLFIGKNAYGITELDAMAAQTYFVPATPTKTDPLAQYWVHGWKADGVGLVKRRKFGGNLRWRRRAKQHSCGGVWACVETRDGALVRVMA